jgi:hypothetical protein
VDNHFLVYTTSVYFATTPSLYATLTRPSSYVPLTCVDVVRQPHGWSGACSCLFGLIFTSYRRGTRINHQNIHFSHFSIARKKKVKVCLLTQNYGTPILQFSSFGSGEQCVPFVECVRRNLIQQVIYVRTRSGDGDDGALRKLCMYCTRVIVLLRTLIVTYVANSSTSCVTFFCCRLYQIGVFQSVLHPEYIDLIQRKYIGCVTRTRVCM